MRVICALSAHVLPSDGGDVQLSGDWIGMDFQDGTPKWLAHGLVVVGAGGLFSLGEFVLIWHLVSSRCLQSNRSKRMVFFCPDLGSHPASLLFRHKELTEVSLVRTGGTRIKEF